MNTSKSAITRRQHKLRQMAAGDDQPTKQEKAAGETALLHSETAVIKPTPQPTQEELLRATMSSISDGVIACDPKGQVIFLNPAAQNLTGWSPEEAQGQSLSMILSIVNEVSRHRVEVSADKALREGVVVGFGNTKVLIAKDSSERLIDDRAAPIRDEQGTIVGVILVLRDISNFKRLEKQFLQAQRMEAVGRLAGGVAHDFNNLLTIISGYSELALQKDPADREMIKEIQRAGERAASLTRQLLAFSRQQVLAPQVLNLNAVIGNMEKMLVRLIGEDVRLETALDQSLGRVKADPGQIEQVLMNLAVNSRDAMPQGGKLTIKTSNAHLDEAFAKSHPEVQTGRYVLLAISDTGCGMNQETLSRIFEPFFTTKGPGQGTGLGLATVYGIIKQSGGYIYVDSEPGRGSTFKIFLPQVESMILNRKSQLGISKSPGGHETVLLVEDENTLRILIRRTLEMKGYKVLEAEEAEDALQLSARHQGPIHLLLSDVVMPRMSGRELADRLGPLRSEMKVLYLSGYTNDAVVRHGLSEGEIEFLQKPFTPDVLARKVREVLDS
jgi:PAS domain S-box-containing protein